MKYARMGAALLLLMALPAAAIGQDGHRHGAEGAAGQHMMGMHQNAPGNSMMGGMMMGPEMDMMGMPGMSMMTSRPGPGMILKQSEALGLSPEQIKRLEALQEEGGVEHESHMTAMRDLHARLSETLRADDVNIQQYEALLRRMADEKVSMHVEALDLRQQALSLLSEEQRGKLRTEHPTDQRMMGMMGAEGMAGHECDMTGGGADETS